MRNLVVHQDSATILTIDQPEVDGKEVQEREVASLSSVVVALAHDFSLRETYLLCSSGEILSSSHASKLNTNNHTNINAYEVAAGVGSAYADSSNDRRSVQRVTSKMWDLNSFVDSGGEIEEDGDDDHVSHSNNNNGNNNSSSNNFRDNSWFSITLVADSGSLVCLSHSGNIMSIKEEAGGGGKAATADHEGVIDEGIVDAKWNPDQTVLVMVTGASTMIAMSAAWEVVFESPIPTMASALSAQTRLCWSGDGAYFTLLSTDESDGLTKLRYFSDSFEIQNQGRHVAEGAAGVLRGLGMAVSCSNSGTMVAVPILKARKWQICLLERNGFTHGGFELQTPAVTTGYSEWLVHDIHWDLPSTLIAISLRAYQVADVDKRLEYQGVVQIYYRSNYYWYLKQEFRGARLFCLGFDYEMVGRLYLSSSVANSNKSNISSNSNSGDRSSSNNSTSLCCFRVVDLTWDSSSTSDTAESWTMVVDGRSVKGTPLGVATIPPPMFHTLLSPELPSSCKALSMWTMPDAVSASVSVCGVACLCSDDTVRFYLVSPDGDMLLEAGGGGVGEVTLTADVASLGNSSSSVGPSFVTFRSLKAVPSTDGRSLSLLVLGTRSILSRDQDNDGVNSSLSSSSSDVIFIYTISFTPSVIAANSWKVSFEFKKAIESHDSVSCLAVCPTKTVVENADRSMSSHAGSDLIAIGLRQVDLDMGGGGGGGGNDVDIDNAEMMVSLYRISDLVDAPSSSVLSDVDAVSQYLLPECCHTISVLSTTGDDYLEGVTGSNGGQTSQGGTGDVGGGGGVGSNDDDNDDEKFDNQCNNRAPMTTTVVGLSIRQKLFCGEFLLASAVSSFACNESLRSVLFVTGGTKSLLNFVSYAGLLALDPLLAEDQPAIELGEPRPVERGTRLVCSVRGSPKVVVQLPRGNLEAFEPRPLVLMRVRSLLDAHEYFTAIQLVRKQRIDMNLLVDHNPSQFLLCLPKLVADTLKVNPEFLSLLIAALDDSDITLTKYPPPSNYRLAVTASVSSLPLLVAEEPCTPSNVHELRLPAATASTSGAYEAICRNKHRGEDAKPRTTLTPGVPQLPSQLVVEGLTYPGDTVGFPRADAYAATGGKVNYICRWLRWTLQKSQLGIEQVLNPTLCVLTRQTPPRLQEAVALVKSIGVVKNASQLQASTKYLAFLVSNEKLFHTAFAECDFEMARLIARQGQMDPKEFNPLLERFESIAKGAPVGASSIYLYMKFQIQVYLSRNFPAIECGICFLNSISKESLPSLSEEVVDVDDFISTMHRLIKSTDSFVKLLPVMSSISNRQRKEFINFSSGNSDRSSEGSISSSGSVTGAAFRVYQLCLQSYADHSAAKGEHVVAASSYLALSPPKYADAIRVAKLAGQWTYAVSIASMAMIANSSSSSTGGLVMTPARVAQEIVSEFKQGLEQGEFSDDSNNNNSSSNGGAGGDNGDDSSRRGDEYLLSRALEASRLAVDYCSDVETAVAILTTAKHWKEAMRLSTKHGRVDLLREDVAEAIRHDAKETIKLVKKNQKKLGDLVAELEVVWKDPEKRLQLVSETDPVLTAELAGDKGEGGEDKDITNDGLASEYSAVSRASQLSYVSKASRVSKSSQASGMSHVSVLSTASYKSTASSNASSSSKASSFAVEGLQHALLSRGSADTPSDAGSRRGGDRKQRGDPSKAGKLRRGEDKRDTLGLRREAAVCEEVVGIISWVARLVRPSSTTGILRNLIESLVIVQAGNRADADLAVSLQDAVDGLALQIQQLVVPLAPGYPRKWLVTRAMTHVSEFQQPSVAATLSLSLISADEPGATRGNSSKGISGGANAGVADGTVDVNNSASSNPTIIDKLVTCVDDWLKTRKLVLL